MSIKIKRSLIYILFLIIAFFALNNVFARDLVYEAKLDASKYLTYANYVKSYEKGDGEIKYPNDDITDNFVSSSSWYKTVGIIFHKTNASSYSDSKRGGSDQLVFFDVSKNNLDPLSLGLYRDSYTAKVRGGGTYVGNDTSNNISDAIYIINSDNKPDGENTLMNIQSRTDSNYFTENRFKIGPNTVTDLRDSLKNQNITVDNGFYRVKFSNIISTGDKQYYTAQAMFNKMASVGYEIRNYGMWHKWINMTNYDTYSHDGEPIGLESQYWQNQVGATYWFPAGSVLNEYDNEMLIPVGEERSVYVVHWLLNEDGTRKRFLPDYQSYNKLPNEVQTDSNGEKRHWYGWSEQYTSNNQLEIYNKLTEINNKTSSEYKLVGYEIYEVNDDGSEGSLVAEGSYDKVGMLQNDEPWISFDSGSHNVVFGSATGATKIKNYAVHYKYAKGSGSKTVYVGHAYGGKNTKGFTYDFLKSNNLSGSETAVSASKSNSKVDGWLNEYSFYDNATIKNPSVENSKYTLVGYIKAKYTGNSIKFNKLYIKDFRTIPLIEEKKSEKININVNNNSVIIFIYDDNPSPTYEKETNINVLAWLDYINPNDSVYSSTTSKEYKGSGEYKNTTLSNIYAEFKNTTGFADTVPSNSKLKPYIRTAPFVIQGIKIEPSKDTKKITSDTCTIEVSYSYKTSCKHSSEDGTKLHDYDTASSSYTGTYTRDINVEWWKYKIFNLTMAHISDITIEQDNIAKLFDSFNNKIELNDNFYKDKVIATPPDIKAYLNTTSKSGSVGLYDSSSEARSAAKSKADELAKSLKIDKLEYTIYDDKIYVNDNYSDILKSDKYTATIENINGASSYVINKDKVSTGKRYNEVIKSYIKWDTEARLKEMTKYTDFKDKYSTVSTNFTKENGVRELTATLTYKSKNIEGSSTYKPTWYSTIDGAIEGEENITFGSETTEFTLDNENEDKPKVRLVDVYDPIAFEEWEKMVETEDVVDHTLGSGVGKTLVLQPNTDFTVTPKFKNDTFGYGANVNSTNNIKKCWVVFDFPVIKNGVKISEGTKIEVVVNRANTFRTTDDFRALTTNNKNNIRLFAYSKNVTSSLENYYNGLTVTVNKYGSAYHKLNLSSKNFIDTNKNDLIAVSNTAKKGNQENYITKGVTYSSNHAITTSLQENSKITNVFRMYDFAVTDCTDLAYKDVFRTSSSNKVSEHTNKVYWSGINKLIVYSSGSTTQNNNYIVSRDAYADENGIGSSPKRILPLGPYKNTNSTYISAPKLGYRISFDLKTTGNLENYSKRKIVIIPRYYFVSKSGEYTPPEDIRLYYRNNSGKYVKLAGYDKKSGNITSENYLDYYNQINGNQFNISFKPNDGYRFLRNNSITSNSSNMANSNVALNISKIELTSKMMTTDDEYIQCWYGEFKLPNSTFVVKKDSNGKYNVNNPLTDGYIGVIFDIYCIDTDGKNLTLSYSQNSRDTDGNLIPNSSQWDYEGYLGISNVGSEYSTSLQLEKGTWNITSDIYKQIKGTVLLYDADNRAAEDYD